MDGDDESTARAVAAFLRQAGRPLALDELLAGCPAASAPVLAELRRQGRLFIGRIGPGSDAVGYCWWEHWKRLCGERDDAVLRRIEAAVAAAGTDDDGLNGPAAVAFQRFLVDDYRPPPDKRWLVLLQCSVRRPFSTAPSHAPLRRAIATATGEDPRRDFAMCPVHVVVLASRLGPVPYELETVWPATVGGPGVKQFGEARAHWAIPILAGRLADYLTAHRGAYDQIATFTDGRYAEVVRQAAERLDPGRPIRILPEPGGRRVLRLGESVPRTCWQRHWIQLYRVVAGWLEPAMQEEAAERLAGLEVEIDDR